jgi:hypothetical protein
MPTQSFLWARAWLGFGIPVQRGHEQLGDILIFDFGGGDSHVTFHDGQRGDDYLCLGGNQSNQVKISPYPKSQCIGIRRTPAPSSKPTPLPSVDDPAFRPLLQKVAMGPDVSDLQRLLGEIEVDGQFGPETDAAVRSYQASHGLHVDGEVGPQTWNALLSRVSLPAANDQIISLARNSPLARYHWPERGVAPVGYINGVAVTFARVYLKLNAGDSAALAMTAPIGAMSSDALAWYGLRAADRPTMLRQLFALLYGLGMRESSGNCFAGRDQSADNVTADTAEAGLFQQSWNSHTASPELPKLFACYSANPDGFLSIFREGVPGSTSPDEGSGDGAAFQALCKSCPAFAVEAAAVGLRTIRRHWGPINRHEAEVRPEADKLLQQVQGVIDSTPIAVPSGVTPTGELRGPTDPIADILKRVKQLENIATGTAVSGPSMTSTSMLSHLDVARFGQDIARLGQIADTLSQFATKLSAQRPKTGRRQRSRKTSKAKPV